MEVRATFAWDLNLATAAPITDFGMLFPKFTIVPDIRIFANALLVGQLQSFAAPGVTRILGNAIQLQNALGIQQMACVALGSLQPASILEAKNAAQSMDIGMCSQSQRNFVRLLMLLKAGTRTSIVVVDVRRNMAGASS